MTPARLIRGRVFRRRVSTVVAVAVLLFVPASAAVVPVNPVVDVENGGLFGVRLGQTDKQVRQALGRPDDVTKVPRLGIHWFYERFDLQMFLNQRTKRVDELFTGDAGAKTASRVGVGSTEQQIVQAFPDALCVTTGSSRGCNVGGRDSVTTFYLQSGSVHIIEVEPASPLPVALNPLIDVTNGGMFGVRVGQTDRQIR
jgi:hypothetical protein